MNAPTFADPDFDPARVRERTAAVVAALPGVEWITDNRVERLSQDFYWFSPVLKRQLEGLRADALNACRGARRASLHEEWRIHWLAAKQKP